MYWLIFRLHEFWQSNKGRRLTIMTVPDGHGEVRTISVPVLGIYIVSIITFVALFATTIIVWNYYSVRSNYTTTFELLQKKNNQYEAVMEGSKEQREVVESLLNETEQLKDRLKQLEGVFHDVNRLLEQTGKKPVKLPPMPEKPKNQTTAYKPNSKYVVNRLSNNKSNSVAIAGVALAAATENYVPERSEQELAVALQNELTFLRGALPETENTANKIKNTLTKKKDQLDRTPSIWPVRGYISSSYGWRNHPVIKIPKRHAGMDIAVPRGTPVKATALGKVTRTGYVAGYGILVEVDHGNGLKTLYAHNSRVLVKKGEMVKKGQVIAYSGNTGVSTGDHLHYEIRKNGKDINPANYLP